MFGVSTLNDYNRTIREFKIALPICLEIYKCNAYLTKVGVNSELSTYEEFNIINENNEKVRIYWSSILDKDTDILSIELYSSICDSFILIQNNYIMFSDYSNCELSVVMFEIDNPRILVDDESYFQASTVHDLSTLDDDREFIPLAMKCFDEIKIIINEMNKENEV